MALIKADDSKRLSSWSRRDESSTRHKISRDSSTPAIDYEQLNALCRLKGLADSKNPQSSEDAHRYFMENYHKMFISEKRKSGLPVHSFNRSQQKLSGSCSSMGSHHPLGPVTAADQMSSQLTLPVQKRMETESHDIRDYLPLLHKQRKSEKPETVQANRIQTLRRLLHKLPFERTSAENEEIYKAVKKGSPLGGQVPTRVLKELCVMAQLDHWREEDLTVFGNTGFHMVLKGTVRAQSMPYKREVGEPIYIEAPTPMPDEEEEKGMAVLGAGEWFGTLDKIEGRQANSRVLTVITLEPNCEFMKISASDYHRVVEQIQHRDEMEKVNLLQSCKNYQMWSKQPLVRVANLIEWTSFPPNTVLVSEGYKAPFLAIIKSGQAHVLRRLEVLQTLPNGKKERRMKQVVMGNLTKRDTFGEISVILDEPMSCSVVTAEKVELAIIYPPKLDDLDNITLQLLQQSSERTYGHLTEDDIQQEYIQQELKREWNEFKHSAVVDAINSHGVRPGYGKWAK